VFDYLPEPFVRMIDTAAADEAPGGGQTDRRAIEGQAAALIAQYVTGRRQPCVTCSFQTESIVLIDLIRRIEPSIPVLFLDTLHHFAETETYAQQLTARWGLNLIVLRSREPQPGLWRTDSHACCARHKVEPLFAALEEYDTWFTGLRREQSPSRAALQEVESFTLPSGKRLQKVSPLVSWMTDDVWSYARNRELPLLSLYERGFTSIGCEPCTSLPLDPSNRRSGRWNGEKLECGIHLQPRT
jgi:phosphoadenosine phosphosulfate reductase